MYATIVRVSVPIVVKRDARNSHELRNARGNSIGKETTMKNRTSLFVVALFVILCAGAARADLFPANPTSADNLKLSLERVCSRNLPYKANSYVVTMSQNNITVKEGDIVPGIVSLCPAQPREEFDLGRLPAGDYTLTVVDSTNAGVPNRVLIDHSPFTVTDAHATKVAPYVRLDYSGHWWDPSDPGWGLFIWHDARDNVLAAWFTYTPDGKPMWYVFQPVFNTSSATRTVDLLQTSRAPGPTSPPPGPNTYAVIGSASLDFAHYDYINNGDIDTGILSYTFTGGAKLVRNIRRFKP